MEALRSLPATPLFTLTAAALLGAGLAVNCSGGTAQEGSRPGRWTLEDVRTFGEFPLFWADEEYADQPLTEIIRAAFPATERSGIRRSENSVTFLYGSCEPPEGEGGCAPPYQLNVKPACYSPPEQFEETLRRGPPIEFRGAEAQPYGENQLIIWTQNIAITVSVEGPGSPESLAMALQPLNSLAQLTSDGRLLPPVPFQELAC